MVRFINAMIFCALSQERDNRQISVRIGGKGQPGSGEPKPRKAVMEAAESG